MPDYRQSKAVFFALLCTSLLFVSCTSKPSELKNARRYPIDGKVVAVDKAKKEITLQHREIPGFMAAHDNAVRREGRLGF